MNDIMSFENCNLKNDHSMCNVTEWMMLPFNQADYYLEGQVLDGDATKIKKSNTNRDLCWWLGKH